MKLLEINWMKNIIKVLKLYINITNVVCLGYMHCVCIGVNKHLIEFWIKQKRDIRLTDESREGINNDLKMLKPYVPSEVFWFPQPIDNTVYSMATEYVVLFYIQEQLF